MRKPGGVGVAGFVVNVVVANAANMKARVWSHSSLLKSGSNECGYDSVTAIYLNT